MAFLDTLKSTAGAITKGVLGPIGGSIVNAGTKALSSLGNTQAKSAASMSNTAPTVTKPSEPLTYKSEPTSSYATGKPIGQTPVSNVSSGVSTQSGAKAVAPTPNNPAFSAPAPATPAPAPKVNTQVSGSNPFGNSSYTPTFSTPTAPPAQTFNNTPPPVAPGTVIAPPPTGYVNAPPPTADALNGTQGTQNNQLSELQKALLGTYQQTPEEMQAQQALQRLAQQQAELSGAFRSGTNKIGEQPIVLDLLRGQQQALQKQYEGQVGALGDQAKPLEVQLANLIANRDLQNKALTTQYGFASEEQKRQDAIAAAQASGSKPIEVGGSLLQLNPQTGQYEVIYQAPSKASEGFTLGEGQMRFDANGNLVASGGEKSSSGTVPTVRDINGVSSQYDPATGNWTPIGNNGSSNAGRPLSAVQANTLAEGENLTASVLSPIYDLLKNKANLFGPTAGLLSKSPYATDTKGAVADLSNAAQLVGSYLEGGKLAEGDIGRYRAMLPQITDTPAVAKSKLDSVSKLIKDKQNQYIQSYGQAGYDVSNFGGGGQQGGDSLDNILNGLGFKNAPSKALNSSLGSLSAKYESGGNPGAIGYDKTGGYSYGTYQLAHNNAQRFVQESPYAKAFAGIPFNSQQFQQRWKEIAQKDPQGFAKAQHDYIAKTHYDPVINRIAKIGVDPSSLSQTAKDVIWSTAVQHGPNNKIIEQALTGAKSEEDFIKKVYQLRWSNGSGFASSTPAVQKSVYNRFFGPNGELATALSRLS